uniref:Uncharacterized protein n=1 Tax=Arundo donax TaxID=35708 RepID=A0A0A9A188_ARUDO
MKNTRDQSLRYSKLHYEFTTANPSLVRRSNQADYKPVTWPHNQVFIACVVVLQEINAKQQYCKKKKKMATSMDHHIATNTTTKTRPNPSTTQEAQTPNRYHPRASTEAQATIQRTTAPRDHAS